MIIRCKLFVPTFCPQKLVWRKRCALCKNTYIYWGTAALSSRTFPMWCLGIVFALVWSHSPDAAWPCVGNFSVYSVNVVNAFILVHVVVFGVATSTFVSPKTPTFTFGFIGHRRFKMFTLTCWCPASFGSPVLQKFVTKFRTASATPMSCRLKFCAKCGCPITRGSPKM